ncbi:hypothetical protein Scep_013165 [Stephania cephalantha]|uniref:Uncharacterized protein n=1 Tax=Stephania cephalantha TaxID=152367 RepID=A0AAP0JIS2_9MAGN
MAHRANIDLLKEFGKEDFNMVLYQAEFLQFSKYVIGFSFSFLLKVNKNFIRNQVTRREIHAYILHFEVVVQHVRHVQRHVRHAVIC